MSLSSGWGDPRSDITVAQEKSCYDAYCTSYLVPWQMSVFGIRFVTADPQSRVTVSYDPPLPRLPLKAESGTESARKLLAGDWNWSKNRHLDQPSTIWHHRASATLQLNILFGDGHAEDFTFPAWYETLNDGGSTDAAHM